MSILTHGYAISHEFIEESANGEGGDLTTIATSCLAYCLKLKGFVKFLEWINCRRRSAATFWWERNNARLHEKWIQTFQPRILSRAIVFHFSLESILVFTCMRKICCAVLKVSHEEVLIKN